MSRTARSTSAGFSLIEVTISIGIVGFALVSMIGLLPMGLVNFRQAMDNTIESRILQSISSELELSDFSNLKNETAYYDADGNITTSSSSAFYTANLTFNAASGASFPVDLTNDADLVTINIVNKTYPNRPKTYSLIVADETD